MSVRLQYRHNEECSICTLDIRTVNLNVAGVDPGGPWGPGPP